MFAELFTAIQQRIAALKDNDNVAYFRFIDQDLGQLEQYDRSGKPAVSFPCALIDIDDFSYTDRADLSQEGRGMVKIRIGFTPYSAASNISPEESRTRALDYYRLEQIVFKAFHGWVPSYIDTNNQPVDLANIFGHFLRRNSFTEERNDFIRVRVMPFAITLEDYSAKPTRTTTPAVPAINVHFPA